MRSALVPVSTGATTTIAAQSEVPANIVISNVGAGVGGNGAVYVSNEGNAHATGAGVPIPLNERMVWGHTDRPLFAYCVGETTEIIVTFLDQDDEIQL